MYYLPYKPGVLWKMHRIIYWSQTSIFLRVCFFSFQSSRKYIVFICRPLYVIIKGYEHQRPLNRDEVRAERLLSPLLYALAPVECLAYA